MQRLLAGFLGTLIGADELALDVLEEHVAGLRRDGALGWLPYAQEGLAQAQLVAGRLHDADVMVTEASTLAGELGQDIQVTSLAPFAAWLAAVRGDTASFQRHHDHVVRDDRGHQLARAIAVWAGGIADLTRSEPARALAQLDQVCRGTTLGDVTIRAIPDYVEAAVRAGLPGRAGEHLPVLERWAAATGSPAGHALVLRCRALLADGEAAELFEGSLKAGAGPYDQARTQLLYGEWLRRHRRPSAAREMLAEALATFDRIAAQGWSARVEGELVAVGAAPPERSSATGRDLTSQELQVVRLAAGGLTNREIGAQLFLSPRTVGHHLYKAYPKLGVNRRAELARLEL